MQKCGVIFLLLILFSSAHVLSQTADAGEDTTICQSDDQIRLRGYPNGGIWTSQDEEVVLNHTNNFTVWFLDASIPKGEYTLTYLYEDPVTNIQTQDKRKLTVLNSPDVTLGSDTTVCRYLDTFHINHNPKGGIFSAPETYFDPFTQSIQPSKCEEGSYVIRYSYTAQNGCTAFDSMRIRIEGFKELDAGEDIQLCEGFDTLMLEGTPKGGFWAGPGIMDSFYLIEEFTSDESFKLAYKYGDTLSCQGGIDSLNIIIHPTPQVSAGGDLSVCHSEDSVTLKNIPGTTYWYGKGVPVRYENTFFPDLAGPGNHRILFEYLEQYSEDFTCTGYDTFYIKVSGTVVRYEAENPVSSKAPHTVFFVNNSKGTADQFIWYIENEDSLNIKNPVFTFFEEGAYDIGLIAKDTQFGCSDTLIKKDYILIGESLSLLDQQTISYNIYPNPVYNILNLEFDKTGHSILKILNFEGKFLYSAKVMEQLDVSFLKSGSYFLVIDDEVVIPFIKE